MTITYVAVGDSQSEGVGDVLRPDGAFYGWTDRLADRLAAHHGEVAYANFAVRGKLAAQILDEQAPAALALKPQLVTVSAGGNDALRPGVEIADVLDVVERLVAAFRAQGANVLLLSYADLTKINPLGRMFAKQIAAFNVGLFDIGAKHGAQVLAAETGSVFEDLRAWSPDRLHLSPLGHQRLACAAAEALGLPRTVDWAARPAGAAPRRTIKTELQWALTFLAPWILRRLRGVSSGDGCAAKQPVPRHIASQPDRQVL